MAGHYLFLLVDRALNPDQIMLLPERVLQVTHPNLEFSVTPEPGRVGIAATSAGALAMVRTVVVRILEEWGCLLSHVPVAPPAPPEAPEAPPEAPEAPPEAGG